MILSVRGMRRFDHTLRLMRQPLHFVLTIYFALRFLLKLIRHPALQPLHFVLTIYFALRFLLKLIRHPAFTISLSFSVISWIYRLISCGFPSFIT